jgi:lysozyme family protein
MAGDRGGRTGRGGITHATYDAYRARKGLPKQDVWRISDQEIAEIYKKEYWDPVHGDQLKTGVDLAVFDYAINSGPAKAYKARIAASDCPDATGRIHKICAERLSFMHALGSSWARFGAAWGKRVARCEATSLKMAGADLGAVAKDAKAAMQKNKQRAAGVTAAGAGAAVGAHRFLHAGGWVIAGLCVVGAAIIVHSFLAWRHGQRADALTAAIDEMRAADAAASQSKTAARAEATMTEKTIAASQAELAAAKDAINKSGAA